MWRGVVYMICEEVYEEGAPCPEEGCKGTLRELPSRNCSCHINPPCSSCTDAGYGCDKCTWTNVDTELDSEPYYPTTRYDPGSRRHQTTGTHVDNPFNSTPFTNCCGIAAVNEDRCPNCKALITYHNDGLAERRREVGPGNCLMCRRKRGNPAIAGNCCC